MSPHSCRAGFSLVHLISPPLQASPRGISGARDSSLAGAAAAANNSLGAPIAPAQGPQDPPVLPSSALCPQSFPLPKGGCWACREPSPSTSPDRDSCFPARARALHGKAMASSAGPVPGDIFLPLGVARLLTHGSSTASAFGR